MEAERQTAQLHLLFFSFKPNTQSHPKLYSNPPAKFSLCLHLQKIMKQFYSNFPHPSYFASPQLHEAFSMNLPAKPDPEMSGPANQVD